MGSTHRIARPDGVELAVERRGDGPVALLTVPFFSPRSAYEGLVAELARENTVVAYDPRGCGESSRQVVARVHVWLEEDVTAEARTAGERLWILAHPQNPWFTPDLLERTREVFPQARLEQVEDGPLSRPDITGSLVRRLTAAR